MGHFEGRAELQVQLLGHATKGTTEVSAPILSSLANCMQEGKIFPLPYSSTMIYSLVTILKPTKPSDHGLKTMAQNKPSIFVSSLSWVFLLCSIVMESLLIETMIGTKEEIDEIKKMKDVGWWRVFRESLTKEIILQGVPSRGLQNCGAVFEEEGAGILKAISRERDWHLCQIAEKGRRSREREGGEGTFLGEAGSHIASGLENIFLDGAYQSRTPSGDRNRPVISTIQFNVKIIINLHPGNWKYRNRNPRCLWSNHGGKLPLPLEVGKQEEDTRLSKLDAHERIAQYRSSDLREDRGPTVTEEVPRGYSYNEREVFQRELDELSPQWWDG